MRYRYFSVLSGRKVFTLLVVLFVLPVGLQSCGRLNFSEKQIVRQNVYFDDSNLGGLSREEAGVVIARLAELKRIEPINAVIDPITRGIIPHLNGLELDVEKTLAQALLAKENSDVKPVYREIAAENTLDKFPESPIYQGNPLKEQVTFLINVAWGNEYLEEMLDVLQSADVQATFFLVGRWVRSSEEVAKSISDAGFEVANHGDSDALSMGRASLVDAAADIRKANDTIESICGVRPLYFSPHKGELSENVLKAAASENTRLIMWSLDTVDWKLPGVDWMLNKVLTNVEGGSLILMHPTAQTAEFLRQVIPALQEKQLEPVTLTELLSPTRVQRK